MKSIRALCTRAMVFSAIVLATSPVLAVTDGDLKREPKPDDVAVRKLESSLSDSSINEELEEADTASYEVAAKELTGQERNLRTDIVRIEKQIASLKLGKERAKQNVELNRKKMEFQKSQNMASRRRAVQALAVKTAFDQENAKLIAEVNALAAEGRDTDEEAHKLETFIKMAQAERQELLGRRAQTKAGIDAQRQKTKLRHTQYEAYRKTTKELEKKEPTVEAASFRQSASLGGN